MSSSSSNELLIEPSEQSPLLPHLSPIDLSTHRRSRQWPKTVALFALLWSIILILLMGFFAPATGKSYAEGAVVVNVSNVSVYSYTENGANVHVAGTVHVNANLVENLFIRTFGRLGSSLLQRVHLGNSTLRMSLPAYADTVVGTAVFPAMTLDIRNGRSTKLDIIFVVEPTSPTIVTSVIQDYIQGTLDYLIIHGEASVGVRSGWLRLGRTLMFKDFVLKGLKWYAYSFLKIPQLPTSHRINNFHVSEVSLHGKSIISASAAVILENPFGLELQIPLLGFSVSLPGCKPLRRLKFANVSTQELTITPNTDVEVQVSAMIESIPNELTDVCPGILLSPMDLFVGTYLLGDPAMVYVTGDALPMDGDSPTWLAKLLHGITFPVLITGHPMDNMIRSFDLSQVSLKLPPPTAHPDSPEALPYMNATVEVLVTVPDQINISFSITRLRVRTVISYKKKPFGWFDSKRWIEVKTTLYGGTLGAKGTLRDLPINITNYDVFESVVQELILGNEKPYLEISGNADVDTTTGLGNYVIRDIPISGNIILDHIPDFQSIPLPKLQDILVESTTTQSMVLKLGAIADNPTSWSVAIPYANILLSHQNITLGNATVQNLHISQGKNEMSVTIEWNPMYYGGVAAVGTAERLIGKYISGKIQQQGALRYNTTLSITMHEQTFPSMPLLSQAFSAFTFDIPIPYLPLGNSKHSDKPQYIKSATMHILSSTADFCLQNPFPHDSVRILKLDGTAKYNGTVLGSISYNIPFPIHPGRLGGTITPRFPVKWKLGSIGYEAMKRALGGSLEVHGEANCQMTIDDYFIDVFYNASDPVVAQIRL
ncbi:hypothetical protein EDC01DRAFT_622872 [Geopyxis carbonaria]|nr:hypothetical protein EDC01DRAFT_622872 [Geopyxis carbonaria]